MHPHDTRKHRTAPLTIEHVASKGDDGNCIIIIDTVRVGLSREKHGQNRGERPSEMRREAYRELEELGARKKKAGDELGEEKIDQSFTLQGFTARASKMGGGDHVAGTIPKRSDIDKNPLLIKSERKDAPQGWTQTLSHNLVYLQLTLQPNGTDKSGASD